MSLEQNIYQPLPGTRMPSLKRVLSDVDVEREIDRLCCPTYTEAKFNLSDSEDSEDSAEEMLPHLYYYPEYNYEYVMR